MPQLLHTTFSPTFSAAISQLPEYVELDYPRITALPAALPYTAHRVAGLGAMVQTFGTFQPVWINRLTWKILNPLYLIGIQQAIKDGMPTPAKLPALLVSIEPTLEAAVALILNGGLDHWLGGVPDRQRVIDAIYYLLELHPGSLNALGPDLDYFQNILDSLTGDDEPLMYTPPPTHRQPMPQDLPPGTALDMPMLDLNLQLHQPPPGFSAWGSLNRSSAVPGVHFYVDDYRFKAVLKNPDLVRQTGAAAAVEVNLTTQDTMPGALFYADLWRKRRVSADWQQSGIQVVVDLNVSRRWLPHALLGVPQGWTAYANRAYADDLEHLELAYALARQHAGRDELLYFVYAGGQRARELCRVRGWQVLEDADGATSA